MAFIRVKIGEFEVIANADCYVGLLVDWLRQRIGEVLGVGALQGDIDLCDETGNPRLLWALPATVNAMKVLIPRAVYYLVVRPKPTDNFKLLRPIGKPELIKVVRDRLKRAVNAWGRVKSKLGPDVTQSQLVESVTQCVTQQATRTQRRSARPQGSPDRWHKLRDKLAHDADAHEKTPTAANAGQTRARSIRPTAKV